jgi:hypothetical protein
VVLYPHAEAIRQSVDRPLQPGVIEGHQAAAPLADQVVMVMLTSGKRSLETGQSGAYWDALEEPVLGEQFQRSVDGRQPGPLAARLELMLDFHRAKRARLCRQQVDDSLTRLGSTKPGFLKCGVHLISPARRHHG